MTAPRPASRIPADRGYGIPRARTPVDLFLDGNEGRPPGSDLLSGIEADPDLLHRYPSDSALEEFLADRFGVGDEQVLVTAGVDEALDRACRAVLEPGRELVLPVPTFEMIERYAALAGGRVVEVPWYEGAWPLDAVLDAVTGSTAAIAVVSPNNPTGLTATEADLRELSKRAPHALLIVDLAYGEFGEQGLSSAALQMPNAVVMRTMSKAWGLAGVRVGYTIGPPEVLRWMRAAAGPYPVARISRQLALRRLRTGSEEVSDYIAAVTEERGRLTDLLAELGLRPLPSKANFVFARHEDPVWIRDAMAGMGIAVRAFPGKRHLEDGLRITLPGDEQAFARLEHALRSALRPDALLLDLDGVVADLGTGKTLVDRSLLQRLGRRLPLGLVTGCSRRTTDQVLSGLGTRDDFAVVVTADDAPAKPDPRSIEVALEAVGRRAWMVGDTTTDVRAARGAGVLPLGIAGDGGESLLDAGAARVFDSLEGVESLLP